MKRKSHQISPSVQLPLTMTRKALTRGRTEHFAAGYLFTVFNSGPLYCTRSRNWFPNFTFIRKWDIFPPVLWPWSWLRPIRTGPSNGKAEPSHKGHFMRKLSFENTHTETHAHGRPTAPHGYNAVVRNNNSNIDVYGVVTVRVHPVHSLNADSAPAGRPPSNQANLRRMWVRH